MYVTDIGALKDQIPPTVSALNFVQSVVAVAPDNRQIGRPPVTRLAFFRLDAVGAQPCDKSILFRRRPRLAAAINYDVGHWHSTTKVRPFTFNPTGDSPPACPHQSIGSQPQSSNSASNWSRV